MTNQKQHNNNSNTSTVYPSLQDTIPHAVNQSLALLKMGKRLPETC
jgi:hypothetical protein